MKPYGYLSKYFGSYGYHRGTGAGGSADVFGDAILLVDFADGSTTAEVGPSPTFSRASSIWWPNDSSSDSSMTEFTSGNPAIEAFQYKGAVTDGGVAIQGGIKNWMLQSNNPATTWTSVGSPSSITNSTNDGPDGGTNTAGEIVAAASGDGVMQSSTSTAASRYATCGVFVKTNSGTLGGSLTLSGTGGTPEAASQAFTATTDWQRVVVSTQFTGSATGNSTMQVETTAAGTLYFWGAQLETNEGTTRNVWNACMPFLPTTTTTAQASRDVLNYNSVSGMSSAYTTGTMCIWILSPTVVTGSIYNPTYMAMGNQVISIEKAANKNRIQFRYNGSATGAFIEPAFTAGQWVHACFTWDHANDTYRAYKNAVEDTSTTSFVTSAVTTGSNIGIGNPSTSGNDTTRAWTILSRARIFPSIKDDAEVLAIYNAEKDNYT